MTYTIRGGSGVGAAVSVGELDFDPATQAEAEALAAAAIVEYVDSGSSASGSAGTEIASIEAASGKVLVGINGFVHHAAAANTAVRITYTYSDDTTLVVDTSPNGLENTILSDGGVSPSQNSTPGPRDAAKGVKKVLIATLGTGVGTRYGGVGALEATP